MNCEECRGTTVEKISYVAYESVLTRFEKQLKRLWVALIIAIVLIFASNCMWLVCFSQYDMTSDTTTTTTIDAEQDGDGTNIVGGGDIDYGTESESNS